MPRAPLSTRLLKGQETNFLFGSSRITSIVGSARRTYLAAVAPPQPPPTTTTRRPLATSVSPRNIAQPSRPATASTPPPAPEAFRNCRRVIRVIDRLLLVDAAGKIAESRALRLTPTH